MILYVLASAFIVSILLLWKGEIFNSLRHLFIVGSWGAPVFPIKWFNSSKSRYRDKMFDWRKPELHQSTGWKIHKIGRRIIK